MYYLLAIVSATGMWIVQKYLWWYNAYITNWIAWITIWVVCLLIWYRSAPVVQFHPLMIVLWLCLAGLNIGYSLLYSSWVNLAMVPIVVTGWLTLTLWIAGYLIYAESLSIQFVIWAILIIAGMGVMVYRA